MKRIVTTLSTLKSRLLAFAFALLLVSTPAVMAADPDPNVVAAQGIVTTATTTFTSVATLVVAMVGFFIIVRIVKGIRK